MRYLLSGGQACVLYGGTEFSRDTDIVVQLTPENLAALQNALTELQAERIFVPPLLADFLRRGHACHFRCHRPDAADMRLDVMAVLHRCEAFDAMWQRRSTVELDQAGDVPMLSLPDLVQSKKTQRDKDWGHIRRLAEADYVAGRDTNDASRVKWWLSELRTPAYLLELAQAHPQQAAYLPHRPWLPQAVQEGVRRLEEELTAEEAALRETDRQYWAPLRQELEQLRHERRRPS